MAYRKTRYKLEVGWALDLGLEICVWHKEWGQVKNMTASALQRPTLVLNRNWQPVNVATVARSLVLLWNESARVVDPTDYQTFDWIDWSQLVVSPETM